MKLSLAMAALSAAQVMAYPKGAIPVTDPAKLEWMDKQHQHAIEQYCKGNVVRPTPPELPPNATLADHERRQLIIAGLAGYAIVEAAGTGAGIAGALANQLYHIFTSDSHEIWHDHGYCRTYFESQGGGNCRVETYDRDAGDSTASHPKDNGCSWNNPSSTAPPVVHFTGDQGIGDFSMQWTSTDTVAWSGANNTKTCETEGLCNPQYVFYRDGANIILDTWESQGSISSCQYTKGGDCKGLCMSGVKDQFSSGGNLWGGDCAIPCISDSTLPPTGSS